MSTSKKQVTKPGVVKATADTMPKALPLVELVKAVDALNKDAGKITERYQTVGVQCLMHLKAHGDIGPANRLVAGMPSGIKRNSMASWVLAYGALSINQSPSGRKEAPLAYDKNKKTDPEAGMADPWFNHLPETPLDEVFDLQKAIHGLLQRAKGKTVMLHGKTLSVQHAVDALNTLAALAGEDYQPEVRQLPEGSPARRADDRVNGAKPDDAAKVAADTPKVKADKRLAAAAV